MTINKKFKFFIYCSGKSGSKTLYSAFKKIDKTLHFHNNNNFQHQNKTKIKIKDIILKSSENEKVYIIDSYRYPIERAISSFFTNLNKYCPDNLNMSIEEIINYFNKKKLYKLDSYHSYIEAFNYFDISTDIKFNHDKKYILTQKDNLIFIKLRMIDISHWKDIFKEILGIEISFIHRNPSKNERYKDFLKEYKVSKQYLKELKKKDNKNRIEMDKMLSKEEIKNYFILWDAKSI
jgi:hypothetical protein